MTKLNKEQQKTYDLIVKQLKEKDIRLTKIRLALIKELIVSDHPTTTSIVKSLEEEYGKINVMSVYNTLDLLLDEHIVNANTFNGKQISYEIMVQNAIHFTCIKCHRVYHVDIDKFSPQIYQDLQKAGDSIHFKVDHFKVEVHGICGKHSKNS